MRVDPDRLGVILYCPLVVAFLTVDIRPMFIGCRECRTKADRAIVVLVRPSEIASLKVPNKFEMWLLLNTKAMKSP